MAIRKISVDAEGNVKQYTCSMLDPVGSYPKDCASGSVMNVLNSQSILGWFCVYDGTKWVTKQPQTLVNDLIYAEEILEVEGEPIDTFTIDTQNKPIKRANLVIKYNVPQIETATVVAESDVTKAGTVIVTIDSAKLEHNPLIVSVPVLLGDTAVEVAEKIKAKLILVKELIDVYTVSVDDEDVILTQIIPSIEGLDSSLNIAVENGTCEGLTDDVSSVSTQVCSTSNKAVAVRYPSRDCELTINVYCYAVPSSISFANVAWFGGSTPRFVVGNNVVKLFTADGGQTYKGICIDSSSLTGLILSNPVVTGGSVSPDVLVVKEVTPVEPVASVGQLGILGVVIDGETLTVGEDVYEFCADVAQSVIEGNLPVDITSYAVTAKAVLTLDTNPVAGNTLTIGSKVYTFVATADFNADGEIEIGTDLAGTKLNVVKAIKGTDTVNTAHPQISCGSAFVVNDLALEALVAGVAGNSLAHAETFTAVTNVITAFTTGADCSAPNAVLAIVDAVTANLASLVTAIDFDADTVKFTAITKGVIGDSIVLDEEMAHGVIAVYHLDEGVDGTVAVKGTMVFDADFLYVAVDACTTAVGNWKKTALSALGLA